MSIHIKSVRRTSWKKEVRKQPNIKKKQGREYVEKKAKKKKGISFSAPPHTVRKKTYRTYFQRKTEKIFRLDYLSPEELKFFWALTNTEKNAFLKIYFNQHHRRPRCQAGVTIRSNLSFVDIISHRKYNSLISVVARWASLSSEKVSSKNIEIFLSNSYEFLERLLTCSYGKLKSIEEVLDQNNLRSLDKYFITRVVAPWVSLSVGSVRQSHIRHFLTHVYPFMSRLATNPDDGTLLKHGAFIKSLNEIWLPREEPIFLRRRH